jgi:hypothetical protein
MVKSLMNDELEIILKVEIYYPSTCPKELRKIKFSVRDSKAVPPKNKSSSLLTYQPAA